jgi:hypothetical protein
MTSQIVAIVRAHGEYDKQYGIEISEIEAKLRQSGLNRSRNDIIDMLRYLTDYGALYSGLSESHYLPVSF